MGSSRLGGDRPGGFSGRPPSIRVHSDPMDQLSARVDALESDVRSIKEMLGALAPKIHEMHAFMQAKLPDLATKADLAALDVKLSAKDAELVSALSDKPGKAYLWGIVGVLVATVLAASALGAGIIAALK